MELLFVVVRVSVMESGAHGVTVRDCEGISDGEG